MAANNDHIVRATALAHVEAIEAEAREVLASLADAHGCEAGAQRGYARGRFDAMIELRKALGLPEAEAPALG